MKKSKIPHRKPTGEINAHSMTIAKGSDAQIDPVHTFKLPENKNLAETIVMEKIQGICHLFDFLPPIYGFEKFPTDHGPDFILKMIDSSVAYAELVEIAMLGSGGYRSADRVRIFGDYLDHVVNEYKKKQEKYLTRNYKPIYLIMYASDDRFIPDIKEILAIRFELNKLKNSVFISVFFLAISYDGSPGPFIVMPFRKQLTRNEVRIMRKKQMVRPDGGTSIIKSTTWNGDKFDVQMWIPFPKGTNTKTIDEFVKDRYKTPEEYWRFLLNK
jgi:hypothetical protein